MLRDSKEVRKRPGQGGHRWRYDDRGAGLYVTEFTLNGGTFAADAETRFRERFRDKLRPEQINRLVAWARRLHGLDGARFAGALVGAGGPVTVATIGRGEDVRIVETGRAAESASGAWVELGEVASVEMPADEVRPARYTVARASSIE